jgi:putative flippase GtrA
VERSTTAAPPRGVRARRALSAPHNWVQLAKFCVVGASGYVVNLGVYVLLVHAGLHYSVAAACSFLVAVTNNYTWNRLWTFRHQRGHVAYQGLRFLVVALVALAANELILATLVAFGLGKVVAQAIAIALVTPINFVGNKLWSFRLTPRPVSAPAGRGPAPLPPDAPAREAGARSAGPVPSTIPSGSAPAVTPRDATTRR